MMERLCEQRHVVSDIMLDPSLTKKDDMYMLLKENEWETMAEISKVLQQLTKVTTYSGNHVLDQLMLRKFGKFLSLSHFSRDRSRMFEMTNELSCTKYQLRQIWKLWENN
jgi:hypothetical protein